MRYFILLMLMLTGFGCKDTTESEHFSGLFFQKSDPLKQAELKKIKYSGNGYLIHFESDLDEDAMQAYLQNYNITIISKLTQNKYHVKVDPDPGIEAIKKEIAKSQYIKYIEINKVLGY